jgi:MFS family permease
MVQSDGKESSSVKLIDQIINNYGYGWYTWKTFIVVFFIISLEGFHLTFFGNMLIPLKQYYDMSDWHVQLISSLFFLAVGFGSISAGYFSNQFRRIYILYGVQFALALGHLLLGLSPNMEIFAVLRCIIGYCIGVAVPISLNLLTEYLPIHFRSIMLTGVWFGFVVGQLYNLILVLIIMPNYETNRYMAAILISSSLSIALFLVTLFVVRDSPRNLLLIDEDEEAFQILGELNNGRKLTEEQKQIIVAENKSGINTELQISLKEIFHHDLRKTSVLLIFIWLVNSLIIYGPMLVSSLTIRDLDIAQNDDSNRDIIIQQLIIVLVSSPSNIIGGFVSEIPWLGRTKTTILSFSLSIVFLILTIVNSTNYEYHFGVYLCFTLIAFNVNTTYSCEIYPTKVRDIAIGFLFFCTRVGGFLSQIIYIAINKLGIWVPYYVTIGLCCVNIVLVLLLPIETLDRPLDQDIEQEHSDEHHHQVHAGYHKNDERRNGYQTIVES